MSFGRRSQRDFEDEIQSHLELETDRLIAEGMRPDAARFAARRRFGNVGIAQDRYHDASPWVRLEQCWLDVRYAFRMLRKSPAFTIIAVITLALGIGANTAVFSVVNAVLLRSLPYREPDRLMRLWESLPGMSRIMISYPDYQDWRARSRVFEDIALYSPFSTMTLTGGALPERVGVGTATASLFDLLGVKPIAGRGFKAEDDHAGADRVVMLTAGYWARQYASDPRVLGQSISLDGEVYKIVGILPRTIGLGNVDVWIPMGLAEKTPSFNRGNHPGLMGVGRLKPGVSVAQMNADLARVSKEIVAENPSQSAGIGAGGDSFTDLLVRDIRPALRVMTWAVLCVLLIACVNVANLLLSRATVRRREIALRVAIGASGGRTMRLLLTENLLLAGMGGLLGLAVAYGGIRAIVAMHPPGVPRLTEIAIDLPVLAFVAGVSILTGLVFGILPALQTARVDLNDSLKENARSSSMGGRTLRLRGLLMAAEVALAFTLFVGAGLLIRSFAKLVSVNPGVDPRGVVVGWIDLPGSKYPTEERQRAAMEDILRRVQAIPGVKSAALTSANVLSANVQNKITFEGHPRPVGQEPLLNVQTVTPDYFGTVGMRVVQGRGVLPSDAPGAPPVVWIDETIAKRYFPGEDPVGKWLVHGGFNSTEPKMRVAGVVNDVLGEGLESKASGTLYVPFAQQPQNWMALAIKTSLPPERITSAFRAEVAAFDRDLAVSRVQTLESVIRDSVGSERFLVFVLGVFAAVALALAAVGVYGVISYFVAQRSREIGIRMALGAAQRDIVSLVSGRVLATTLLGIAVGLASAFAARGLITKLLFEVTASDLGTYVVGAVSLILVAMAAAVVPTFRATQVNPAVTMRAD